MQRYIYYSHVKFIHVYIIHTHVKCTCVLTHALVCTAYTISSSLSLAREEQVREQLCGYWLLCLVFCPSDPSGVRALSVSKKQYKWKKVLRRAGDCPGT